MAACFLLGASFHLCLVILFLCVSWCHRLNLEDGEYVLASDEVGDGFWVKVVIFLNVLNGGGRCGVVSGEDKHHLWHGALSYEAMFLLVPRCAVISLFFFSSYLFKLSQLFFFAHCVLGSILFPHLPGCILHSSLFHSDLSNWIALLVAKEN